MYLSLQDSCSKVSRLCISTGNEVEVASSSSLSFTNSFITFGRFDVTVFSDQHNIFKPTSSSKILEKESSELIRWAGIYESPPVTTFINNSKLVAFISIELSSLLQSSYYTQTIFEPLIEKTIDNVRNLGIDIAFYGGIKQSDIHIIAKLQKVEELFVLNRVLREQSIKNTFPDYDFSKVFVFEDNAQLKDIDFPIFHRIDSDLLVSLPYVVEKIDSAGDYGSIEARITVKGNSMSEDSLESFSDIFNKLDTTNGNEWLVTTKEAVPFKYLLTEILKFRNSLSERDGGESFSNTSFVSEQEGITEKSYDYDFFLPKALDFPSLKQPLKNFGASAKELYIASEDLINKYSSLYENNLFRRSISGLESFIHLLINEQSTILKNLENQDAKASTQITEAHQAISVAVDGLTQRLEHNYSIHIKAVTRLLIKLSELAKKHIDFQGLGKNSLVWQGFVFVSRLHGYSLKPYEIYTIPHVSVNQPLSSSVNWHSLTHEMSHWIFDELDLSSEYNLIVEESIKRMGIIASGRHLKHEINKYDQLIYEFFATWFDYYHFYNQEQILFQLHIWRSWSSLSFTEDKISEYVSRSFLVYIFEKKEELIKAYLDDNEKDFIAKEFMLFTKFIKEHVSPRIENCIFNQVNRFEASIALDVSNAVIPLFVNSLDVYCFDEFREKLHQESPESVACMSANLEGEIYTEQLENPFIVINKLLQYLSDKKLDDQSLWKLETALLFSIGAQVE